MCRSIYLYPCIPLVNTLPPAPSPFLHAMALHPAVVPGALPHVLCESVSASELPREGEVAEFTVKTGEPCAWPRDQRSHRGVGRHLPAPRSGPLGEGTIEQGRVVCPCSTATDYDVTERRLPGGLGTAAGAGHGREDRGR